MSACGCVHLSADAKRPEMSDSPASRVTGSCEMTNTVTGNRLWSFAKVVRALNIWLSHLSSPKAIVLIHECEVDS